MSFINSLFVRRFCREVGTDLLGNRYFEGKSADFAGNKKRYVIYKGECEPSRVPPIWHAWLHYLSNELPSDIVNFAWQSAHLPNQTGTAAAYSPDKNGNKRARVSADYDKWQPK